jgi:hypothetical protein
VHSAWRSTIVVATLALSLPFGDQARAGSGAPAGAVEVTPWVQEVCTALSRWIDLSGTADEQIFRALERLDGGEAGTKPTKKAIVSGYERATTVSARLVDGVLRAGIPKVDDATAMVASYLRTLGKIVSVYDDALKRHRKLKTGDAERFAAQAGRIEADVAKAFEEIGMPLDEVLAHPELAPAIRSTRRCTSVIDQYIGLFVSVGDCISESGTIDCEEPHLSEVFFVGVHPAGPNDPYPGDAALDDHVVQICVPEFQRYVGIPVEQSALDFSWYRPSAETWVQGDRQIVCTVANADQSALVGRVRQTAR